jgi:cytochrome b
MQPLTPATGALPPAVPTVPVWDSFVRVFHWTLVACVALAWVTGDEARTVHEVLGYGVLVLVALRVVWGLLGTRYARFAQFVRGPQSVLRYAKAMLARRAPRYIGHNPLGGWMILALLTMLVAVGASGWLMTTDAFFGDELLEEVHEALANGLLGLVALHLGGVVVSSLEHGENLVRAMFTGRKRVPSADDIA